MSGHVAEWRQREVVGEVKAQVARGLEVAGHAVQVDARRRLLQVSEPEWGRKYRQLLALGRLTVVMVEEAGFVEVGVGIPRGEKGGDYGYWIEVGNVNWPAHPWLRPALLENLKEIVRLLAG